MSGPRPDPKGVCRGCAYKRDWVLVPDVYVVQYGSCALCKEFEPLLALSNYLWPESGVYVDEEDDAT